MNAAAVTASLFLDSRAALAESPVWDIDAQELVWTDIPVGALHRTSADGTRDRATRVGPPLACVQRRRGGGLIVAGTDDVSLVDDDGGNPSVVAKVAFRHAAMRFNEGKCDPFGNFVVGALDPDGNADSDVYRITPSGDISLLWGGFGTTNGMEWNDDGTEIYVTDTDVKTVFRASYGPDGVTGELVPFSVGGSHDGLVRDERGEFWGAIYGEGRVVHLDVDGREIGEIRVPADNVTGVAIGGPGMSTLFITSARENATEQELEKLPYSGGIFTVDLDRRGRETFLFG